MAARSREYQNMMQKKYREARAARGLCTYCNGKKAPESKSMCSRHLIINSLKQYEYMERQRAKKEEVGDGLK
jgi:hypothetical protein